MTFEEFLLFRSPQHQDEEGNYRPAIYTGIEYNAQKDNQTYKAYFMFTKAFEINELIKTEEAQEMILEHVLRDLYKELSEMFKEDSTVITSFCN